MNKRQKMVERKGIEPSTFALRTRPYIVASMGYDCFADPKGPKMVSAAHRIVTGFLATGRRA